MLVRHINAIVIEHLALTEVARVAQLLAPRNLQELFRALLLYIFTFTPSRVPVQPYILAWGISIQYTTETLGTNRI